MVVFSRAVKFIVGLLCLIPALLSADEGMFPVSEIGKLDLPSKGLVMAPGDIFNPNQV